MDANRLVVLALLIVAAASVGYCSRRTLDAVEDLQRRREWDSRQLESIREFFARRRAASVSQEDSVDAPPSDTTR